LQRSLRAQLKQTESSQSRRNAILWEVLHDREIWKTLKTDPAGAYQLTKERYLHE
jgi:hypothetical protein